MAAAGHDDRRDEPDPPRNALAVGTLREEIREMPAIQRWIVYASGFCLTFLLLQCFLVMPIILIKYGWGYNVGDGGP